MAQSPSVVIMINGEASATREDRDLALRVGRLLQQTYPQIHVVPAVSLKTLLDGILYAPDNPLEPWMLNDVCRRLRASATVDILTTNSRSGLRGLAFRHTFARRSSRAPSLQIQRIVVGDAIASTPDDVARALVPQIFESLVGTTPAGEVLTRDAIRCIVLRETGEPSNKEATPVPNAGCC